MLHIDVKGRRRGSRVVLVHGFTQTGRSWDAIADRLAEQHQVVVVDAPGHGYSDHIRVDLWQGARLLGEAGGEAAYVGYSMGGRLALHLALAAPYLVRKLVVVGATAGIEDENERTARRTADEELATGLEADGLDIFLDRWLQNPLFDGLSAEASGLHHRRQNTVAGLAASLRLMGTGTQESLWSRLGALTMPVLVVAGANDKKFTTLADRLVGAIGANASRAFVPDAGHAAHLEQPEAFLDVVTPFLGDHDNQIPTANSTP